MAARDFRPLTLIYYVLLGVFSVGLIVRLGKKFQAVARLLKLRRERMQ